MTQHTGGAGAILWQTIMTPEGYPGNAVWGSSPAIDAKRGQLYVATGNNYDAPQETLDCITRAGTDPVAQRACLPADNHFDSVLALDLKTGAEKFGGPVVIQASVPGTGDCMPGSFTRPTSDRASSPTSTALFRSMCASV